MSADRPTAPAASAPAPAAAPRLTLAERTEQLFQQSFHAHVAQIDRMFLALLCGQWVFAIVLVALAARGERFEGALSARGPVGFALLAGALVNVVPVVLILKRPGSVATRHAVSAAQMLWSAILIHLTGGRIETHFHVFGSLACVAFYRDWRVLVTATIVVALHSLAGVALWPQSVYGVAHAPWWRALEHVGWTGFEVFVLVLGCRTGIREMRLNGTRRVALEHIQASIEQKVVRRTAELEASKEQYRALVETANVVPWEMAFDPAVVRYVGPQVERLLGFTQEQCLEDGFWYAQVIDEDRDRVVATHRAAAHAREHAEHEFRMRRADGGLLTVREVLSTEDGARKTVVLRGLVFDVTERKQLESQLAQAQKLESVGRLAAGVAHEINTPVQFVSDSIHFVSDAMNDLLPLLERYEVLRDEAGRGADVKAEAARVAELREEKDAEYLSENVPGALTRALDGLTRIADIVKAMKDFAHPDSREMVPVDINRAVQSTLTVANNEYKYVADVETDFQPLPRVVCHPGEVNQALLNIIVNASHAIRDVVQKDGRRGRIVVTTRADGDDVVVSIADTGGGIPERIRAQVFDPFFTSKGVGEGTGQGLFIARTAIEKTHQGALTFETVEGEGTTFHIRLPVAGPKAAAPSKAA